MSWAAAAPSNGNGKSSRSASSSIVNEMPGRGSLHHIAGIMPLLEKAEGAPRALHDKAEAVIVIGLPGRALAESEASALVR